MASISETVYSMQRIHCWLVCGIVALSLLWGACGSEPEPDEAAKLQQQLQAAFEAQQLDPEKIRTLSGELATALEARSAKEEAESAPEDLFRAAELYEQDIQRVDRALALYQRIVEQYPNHERAADALFKQGYLYHNVLQDLPQAEVAYRTFLERYPQHNLAPSAQEELKYLGISPEEWLQQKQRQARDSTELDSGATGS